VKEDGQSLQALSPAEADAFVERGYVVIRGAFARETAEQLLPQVWARLPEDPRDPSTHHRRGAQIEDILRDGPVAALFTPRYCASVDELLGKDRWWTRRDGFGWVVVRFPDPGASGWQPPTSGWHVDGTHFHHYLNSPEQGLVGIEMFTDIEPCGGGTAVRVGSHRRIARLLAGAGPSGLSYADLRRASEEMRDLPAVEVIGEAGDVLWMHPFLVHARSINLRSRVRVAANRCVAMHEPFRLEREHAGRRSLVERAIVEALAERG